MFDVQGLMLVLAGLGGGVALALILLRLRFQALPLRRRKASVAGEYRTYDSSEASAPCVGDGKIRQSGKRINMEVTRRVNRRGEEQEAETTFSCAGVINSGLLTAIFQDDNASYRVGAAVLKYDSVRRRFLGKTMYFDGGEVVSHHFELRRVVEE